MSSLKEKEKMLKQNLMSLSKPMRTKINEGLQPIKEKEGEKNGGINSYLETMEEDYIIQKFKRIKEEKTLEKLHSNTEPGIPGQKYKIDPEKEKLQKMKKETQEFMNKYTMIAQLIQKKLPVVQESKFKDLIALYREKGYKIGDIEHMNNVFSPSLLLIEDFKIDKYCENSQDPENKTNKEFQFLNNLYKLSFQQSNSSYNNAIIKSNDKFVVDAASENFMFLKDLPTLQKEKKVLETYNIKAREAVKNLKLEVKKEETLLQQNVLPASQQKKSKLNVVSKKRKKKVNIKPALDTMLCIGLRKRATIQDIKSTQEDEDMNSNNIKDKENIQRKMKILQIYKKKAVPGFKNFIEGILNKQSDLVRNNSRNSIDINHNNSLEEESNANSLNQINKMSFINNINKNSSTNVITTGLFSETDHKTSSSIRLELKKRISKIDTRGRNPIIINHSKQKSQVKKDNNKSETDIKDTLMIKETGISESKEGIDYHRVPSKFITNVDIDHSNNHLNTEVFSTNNNNHRETNISNSNSNIRNSIIEGKQSFEKKGTNDIFSLLNYIEEASKADAVKDSNKNVLSKQNRISGSSLKSKFSKKLSVKNKMSLTDERSRELMALINEILALNDIEKISNIQGNNDIINNNNDVVTKENLGNSVSKNATVNLEQTPLTGNGSPKLLNPLKNKLKGLNKQQQLDYIFQSIKGKDHRNVRQLIIDYNAMHSKNSNLGSSFLYHVSVMDIINTMNDTKNLIKKYDIAKAFKDAYELKCKNDIDRIKQLEQQIFKSNFDLILAVNKIK